VLPPGPPLLAHAEGERRAIYELGLMAPPGARTFPMDYNYLAASAPAERMATDLQMGLVFAYGEGKRSPWNVGSHFAPWQGGAYLRAMQDAFEFAAQGCPDPEGNARCLEVDFPSFRELAQRLTTAREVHSESDETTPQRVGLIETIKALPARSEGASP